MLLSPCVFAGPFAVHVQTGREFWGLILFIQRHQLYWIRAPPLRPPFYRGHWSKPSPRKRNAKRQNGCLRRPYKRQNGCLRKEEKQKAKEKGKIYPSERYTHLASLTRWTGVWPSPGSWWWTEKPGMLQSMGSQRVRHDWATELNLWLHLTWITSLQGLSPNTGTLWGQG